MNKHVLALACAVGFIGLTGLTGAPAGATASAPSYTFTGRAVDSSTGNGLGGIKVSARDVVDRSIVLARTTTASDGSYTLRDVAEEEVGLRFNGEARDHETGWQSCTHTVVQKWGNACSAGPGSNGRAKLQRI